MTIDQIQLMATVGATLLGLISFWLKFTRDIAKADARAEAAHAIATAANTLAAAAIAKIELHSNDLNAYKVEAAEKYLVSDDIIQAENRTTRAVEDLRGDVRGMNARLDRMLEKIVEKVTN